jgi:adenylate cyclase
LNDATLGESGPGAMNALLRWVYGKLGRFYPAAFLTVELQTALAVAAITVLLFSVYYEAPSDDWLPIGGIALGTTFIAVWTNLIRTYPLLRPVQRWIKGERSPESTAQAWAAAVSLPLNMIRRDFWVPVFVVVVPTCVAAVLFIDLSWLSLIPLMTGALVAVGYGAILHYLALEQGMRPVLVDINQSIAPGRQVEASAIPLKVRLIAALPLMTIVTGFVVQAITSNQTGVPTPEADFLIAIAAATAIALEVAVLFTKSIISPVADIRKATEAVQRGDYEISVPVTTADELGDLAASFNEMVAGLKERERLREAFGTYLDREVAEYILSEGFSEEGVEVDVSVLFCDVVDFTDFAARAEAREVVSRLNTLFEIVVPVIARHGGHVDKFVGDGLLAVFGAPEPFEDHADRSVRAAGEMARRVNDEHEGPFQIGIGVNSGPVVAGSIGGAGRLNFSVIGDPVNVAARIEACTRSTGDDVLISEETRRRLSKSIEVVPRGSHELKGIADPIELFVPVERERALVEEGESRPRAEAAG